MKNSLICLLICLIGAVTLAQTPTLPVSPFSVRYLVTYDAAGKQFTAWVVPDYDTPNANNPDTDERGVTAQFSLRVPSGFVLTQLQDVRGTWDKNTFKLDPQRHLSGHTADNTYAYYMIGKTPAEVSYGEFKRGEPVALFTFRGEAANPAQVQALDVNDPFIDLADKTLSLNVRGSFYSRSGQDFKPNTRPVEQFVKPITLDDVLRNTQQKATTDAQSTLAEPTGTMVLYPNPAQQMVTVAYFSDRDQVPATVEWIDVRGVVQQTKQAVARQGLNSVQLNVASYAGGTYFVRTTVAGKPTTGKVNKL